MALVQQIKRLGKHSAIYGLGGIVAPFVGIKLIDVLLTVLHLT